MKMNTKETAKRVIAAVIAYFDNDNGLTPTQSYGDLGKALKNCLCEAVVPVLKKQLMDAVDKLIDYVENVPDIKPDATSFIKLLVQVLTPYFPNKFLHFLESTFEDTMKTLKRSPRKILMKTVGKTANRVTNKLQEASLSISSSDFHQFEEFLTDLLKCFFSDLVDEIKNELSVILCNLKTQALQGADRYVTKHLIPELSRLIQSSCGVSVEKQLMSLKPFIIKGLATFLKEGRVINKDEIIQMAKKSIQELVIETAIPNASENMKTLVRNALNQVIAYFDNDNGLTPTQSYGDLGKALKNCLCEAVVPVLKKQLMDAVDKLIDYVENVPDIKPDATSFIKLLVQVLTPYFPNKFLHFLESTFEDTMKTLKRSPGKILPKTVGKTANRVTSKLQEASLSISSSDFHQFEGFLTDLLKCFFSDLVDEIKNELSVILCNLKTQALQGADRYVTKHLIPELSRLIQSSCGVSVEKQLMSLKPFIIKGLATFLKEGRVLNKDEIIQMAKKSIPELVIETAIPNASENTKTLVRNALNQVQEVVFTPRPGTIPSVEKLLKVLFKKCQNKEFCIDKDKLGQVIDKLIELMPEKVDGIMEFLIKHVLPALSGCFEAAAFALVAVFLRESFERLRKEGRVKGRDLAKPLAMKAVDLASNQVAKNTAEEVSKASSTVVTEIVTKNKVTHKIVKKYVIDKAGGKMAVETSKKVAVKSSKSVVAKVTEHATSKTVTTASKVTAKQSVKVGTKAVKGVSDNAVKSIGGKATHQGVQISEKIVQKASVKVTKNLGDGISNGVTEVTKKAAVKKTTKAAVTETAETITATSTAKVTKESVSKTTHISQASSKAAAEVGMKNAAKAGLTAAGVSAVVGGVFLYRDLKDLDKEKEEGSISEEEYKEQKAQRVGEFAGDVIGSGIVGAAVSIAALSGPAGWAAIGVGALFSFATGKLGGQIAKALA